MKYEIYFIEYDYLLLNTKCIFLLQTSNHNQCSNKLVSDKLKFDLRKSN